MFNTQTLVTESALNVETVFDKCESVQEALIDVVVEHYEDLAKLSDFMVKCDLKEAELMSANESAEVIQHFQESAMDKAKNFVKELVAKIKAKFKQFLAFVNKKFTQVVFAAAKKLDEKLVKSSFKEADVNSFLADGEFKVSFHNKIFASSNIIGTLGAVAVNLIKDAYSKFAEESFNKKYFVSEFEKEFGEKKEAILGDISLSMIKNDAKEFDRFAKKSEGEFATAIKAVLAASKELKTSARNLNKLSIKCHTIVSIAYTFMRKAIVEIVSVTLKAIMFANKKAKKKEKKD